MVKRLGHGAPLGAFYNLGGQVQRRSLGSAPLSVLNLRTFYPNGFPSISAGDALPGATERHEVSSPVEPTVARKAETSTPSVQNKPTLTNPASDLPIQRRPTGTVPSDDSPIQHRLTVTTPDSDLSIQREFLPSPDADSSIQRESVSSSDAAPSAQHTLSANSSDSASVQRQFESTTPETVAFTQSKPTVAESNVFVQLQSDRGISNNSSSYNNSSHSKSSHNSQLASASTAPSAPFYSAYGTASSQAPSIAPGDSATPPSTPSIQRKPTAVSREAEISAEHNATAASPEPSISVRRKFVAAVPDSEVSVQRKSLDSSDAALSFQDRIAPPPLSSNSVQHLSEKNLSENASLSQSESTKTTPAAFIQRQSGNSSSDNIPSRPFSFVQHKLETTPPKTIASIQRQSENTSLKSPISEKLSSETALSDGLPSVQKKSAAPTSESTFPIQREAIVLPQSIVGAPGSAEIVRRRADDGLPAIAPPVQDEPKINSAKKSEAIQCQLEATSPQAVFPIQHQSEEKSSESISSVQNELASTNFEASIQRQPDNSSSETVSRPQNKPEHVSSEAISSIQRKSKNALSESISPETAADFSESFIQHKSLVTSSDSDDSIQHNSIDSDDSIQHNSIDSDDSTQHTSIATPLDSDPSIQRKPTAAPLKLDPSISTNLSTVAAPESTVAAPESDTSVQRQLNNVALKSVSLSYNKPATVIASAAIQRQAADSSSERFSSSPQAPRTDASEKAEIIQRQSDNSSFDDSSSEAASLVQSKPENPTSTLSIQRKTENILSEGVLSETATISSEAPVQRKSLATASDSDAFIQRDSTDVSPASDASIQRRHIATPLASDPSTAANLSTVTAPESASLIQRQSDSITSQPISSSHDKPASNTVSSAAIQRQPDDIASGSVLPLQRQSEITADESVTLSDTTLTAQNKSLAAAMSIQSQPENSSSDSSFSNNSCPDNSSSGTVSLVQSKSENVFPTAIESIQRKTENTSSESISPETVPAPSEAFVQHKSLATSLASDIKSTATLSNFDSAIQYKPAAAPQKFDSPIADNLPTAALDFASLAQRQPEESLSESISAAQGEFASPAAGLIQRRSDTGSLDNNPSDNSSSETVLSIRKKLENVEPKTTASIQRKSENGLSKGTLSQTAATFGEVPIQRDSTAALPVQRKPTNSSEVVSPAQHTLSTDSLAPTSDNISSKMVSSAQSKLTASESSALVQRQPDDGASGGSIPDNSQPNSAASTTTSVPLNSAYTAASNQSYSVVPNSSTVSSPSTPLVQRKPMAASSEVASSIQNGSPAILLLDTASSIQRKSESTSFTNDSSPLSPQSSGTRSSRNTNVVQPQPESIPARSAAVSIIQQKAAIATPEKISPIQRQSKDISSESASSKISLPTSSTFIQCRPTSDSASSPPVEVSSSLGQEGTFNSSVVESFANTHSSSAGISNLGRVTTSSKSIRNSLQRYFSPDRSSKMPVLQMVEKTGMLSDERIQQATVQPASTQTDAALTSPPEIAVTNLTDSIQSLHQQKVLTAGAANPISFGFGTQPQVQRSSDKKIASTATNRGSLPNSSSKLPFADSAIDSSVDSADGSVQRALAIPEVKQNTVSNPIQHSVETSSTSLFADPAVQRSIESESAKTLPSLSKTTFSILDAVQAEEISESTQTVENNVLSQTQATVATPEAAIASNTPPSPTTHNPIQRTEIGPSVLGQSSDLVPDLPSTKQPSPAVTSPKGAPKLSGSSIVEPDFIQRDAVGSSVPSSWTSLENLVSSVATNITSPVSESAKPTRELPVATVKPLRNQSHHQNLSTTVMRALSDSTGESLGEASPFTPDPNALDEAQYSQHLELLAQEVYGLLRQRLSLEQERRGPKYPR